MNRMIFLAKLQVYEKKMADRRENYLDSLHTPQLLSPGNSYQARKVATNQVVLAIHSLLQGESREYAPKFCVVEVRELAEHVWAVLEEDGEYGVWYSLRHCLAYEWAPTVHEDVEDFPEGVGFVEDPTSRNWESIYRTARICLRRADGGGIDWYAEPEQILCRE